MMFVTLTQLQRLKGFAVRVAGKKKTCLARQGE